MIDIHSHILPAVDDGSESNEHSLAMLKEAERQGINKIVLTPHYRADYLPSSERLQTKFAEFKAFAAENGILAELYLGQEIYAFDGLVKALNSGKVLSVNGTKYVLVEFSLHQAIDIAETVYMLVSHGYVPIVAHIERYGYADIFTAKEVKEIGGLIQVNADSVCGIKRHRYKRKVMSLIKEGLADFVASDVHFKRVNHMRAAYEKILKKFGRETADKLFTENAEKIIEGQ